MVAGIMNPDGLLCKNQKSNTCSIVAVRIASELMQGAFTKNEKEIWKTKYRNFTDEKLFNVGNLVRLVHDSISTNALIQKRITHMVYVEKDNVVEEFKPNKVKKYSRGRALGGKLEIGDLVKTETYNGTIIDIKYLYELKARSTIYKKVLREDMKSMDGVDIGVSINAFKDYYKLRSFYGFKIPSSIANSTRQRWLIEHLNSGKYAILGIVDFRYSNQTNTPMLPNDAYVKVGQDKDHQIKNVVSDGVGGKGHAIVCVGYQRDPKEGMFTPEKTDGRYLLHDSSIYNGSCRKFLDSKYMDYRDNGGIVKTIYLIDTDEIPSTCERIPIIKF